MITSDEQLDDMLVTPSSADIEAMGHISGDVMLLGASGKMGPTLARRIRRAVDASGSRCRVIAVSRFSDPVTKKSLESFDIECLASDLLCRESVDRLPSCPNILYLVGRKFGTSGRSDLTWAANTIAPTYVADRFRESRMVVFSTGNVYPLRTFDEGGCNESVPLDPHGEYAISAVGRERVFEYFSRQHHMPCLIFRLNYAVDLRYGVLVDIARNVFSGQPVSLSVPYVNVIWQGDANSYALRSLRYCGSPPRLMNVTGARILSVRELAVWFGDRFNRSVQFQGEPGTHSLLNDARQCHELLGPPEVPEDRLCELVADWIEGGGRSLNLATKFDVSSGRF